MRPAILVLALAAAGCASAPDPGPAEPDPRYVTRAVEGWTVRVSRVLLEDEADLGRRALRVLEAKLHEISRAVPERACAELRKVPIWLGRREGTKGAGAAEYHPSAEWLRRNGFNPAKAKAVEIGDAAGFLRFSIPQPSVVLHELAHAYHDRVLGHSHAGIREAFRAAREGGTYETVLHVSGRMRRHYALENEKEFFAEASEAWFGTNDFYPFVRAELRQHDPGLAKVLEEAWGR